MPKNTISEFYNSKALTALGFVHQYDFTDNEGTPDEFSYSVHKLELTDEAYLECTTEYEANGKFRLQYFQLTADEFEILKPLSLDDFRNLKQIFKP